MPDDDPTATTARRRPRGRPLGGGNTAEQARTVLMDAAERSILQRGFQASTMDVIAREAGYSRAAMYRHFPNRRRLLEALVARKTHRHQIEILQRMPENACLTDVLVESLVIVATELIHDPLLQTLSEQTDEGTVAHLVADAPALPELVEQLVEAIGADDTAHRIRPGLATGDIGQFIISTAITMLLGVIPDIDKPDTARRYIQTFVLPAILVDPPPPRPVFER
ncbi:transcriptional regulator [Mycolicibacterium chubuense NBB4]|uniref:Transcriptional regulator n=1 Tax=Mycolicibacterium chubuense (strain NBB4) TaxID=710421 RepID=I4BCV1_MYCCN|nr:TetR/AcrR family transcriptional regulator [Mycolicibacterium chubuense]AFM15108.1 transcriptional regulator [Mycolicibacterium chubuense NBB4]